MTEDVVFIPGDDEQSRGQACIPSILKIGTNMAKIVNAAILLASGQSDIWSNARNLLRAEFEAFKRNYPFFISIESQLTIHR